nr:MAG TPA: hypothetical protein [Caudoviricetes sp.]
MHIQIHHKGNVGCKSLPLHKLYFTYDLLLSLIVYIFNLYGIIFTIVTCAVCEDSTLLKQGIKKNVEI